MVNKSLQNTTNTKLPLHIPIFVEIVFQDLDEMKNKCSSNLNHNGRIVQQVPQEQTHPVAASTNLD